MRTRDIVKIVCEDKPVKKINNFVSYTNAIKEKQRINKIILDETIKKDFEEINAVMCKLSPGEIKTIVSSKFAKMREEIREMDNKFESFNKLQVEQPGVIGNSGAPNDLNKNQDVHKW